MHEIEGRSAVAERPRCATFRAARKPPNLIANLP
jgi:hypothetical protein